MFPDPEAGDPAVRSSRTLKQKETQRWLHPAPDAKDRKSEKRPLDKVAQSLFTEIHSTSPCCAAPV